MDRYLVVSSDGHAGPPANRYRDYLDPAYRTMFDEHQRALQALILQRREELGGDNSEFIRRWEKLTGGDGGLLAAHDSAARLAILDSEGVTCEVLYPDADVLGAGRVAASPFGSGLGGGAGYEPDVAMAGARAHNRWLADFVAEAPLRRVGLAVVPMLADIDAAVAEIRAAHERGLRGVLIPTRWYDYPAYNDDRYEPVWAACHELGMPVHTHAGSGPTDVVPGSRGFLGIYTAEAGWWGYRPLHVLLWSGVFDRYPSLIYVPTELGSFWVEDLFRKLDAKWDGDHNTAKFGNDNPFREALRDRPSDYLGRNIFIGASTPGAEDMQRRDYRRINDAVMWGNDLPHPEGTFPFTKYWIRTRFADLPDHEARQILGLNAARCYGLDVAALGPIVTRVGVTHDEIYGDSHLEAAPF